MINLFPHDSRCQGGYYTKSPVQCRSTRKQPLEAQIPALHLDRQSEPLPALSVRRHVCAADRGAKFGPLRKLNAPLSHSISGHCIGSRRPAACHPAWESRRELGDQRWNSISWVDRNWYRQVDVVCNDVTSAFSNVDICVADMAVTVRRSKVEAEEACRGGPPIWDERDSRG
jgi:hypothetical protein